MSEQFESVWDAIEDTPQAAANMRARAELMREIQRIAKRSRQTQTALATRFGVTQPRLSDLMRGRIDRFSLDALVNMLGAAGVEIEVEFRRRAA
jgi:predicted XRE-type DNA-binding protein